MSLTTSAAEPTLTVRDVAIEAGVTTSAVRFYEQHGLVTAGRTSANHRRFDADAACRIKVARAAQDIGLTVREIADLLATLPPQALPEDWNDLRRHLVEEARRRVRALERILEDLAGDDKLCDLPTARR